MPDHLLRLKSLFLSISMIVATTAPAQSISSFLPQKLSLSEKYLFYLHGGVVTVKGDNAINDGAPEWGPYIQIF